MVKYAQSLSGDTEVGRSGGRRVGSLGLRFEVMCGLGEAASLRGAEFDGFDLAFPGKQASGFAHRRPPHKELTLFTERSPSVGKSSPPLPQCEQLVFGPKEYHPSR
jgi:hypothetical protein